MKRWLTWTEACALQIGIGLGALLMWAILSVRIVVEVTR